MVENYGTDRMRPGRSRVFEDLRSRVERAVAKTATILEFLLGYFDDARFDLPTRPAFSRRSVWSLPQCRLLVARSISASKACAVSVVDEISLPINSAINCGKTWRSCQLPNSSCSSFKRL
jgi:hypothetical protein